MAGESEILGRIRDYFASADAARKAGVVAAIEADPAYRRERVGEWLHRAALWGPAEPGLHELVVDVGLGQARRVTVRVPRGYRTDRAWPVLYALHPSGGDGPSFLPYAEATLGRDVERFLIVAPTHYRQTGLDAPAPFTADHTAILRAVRRRFHVDGDRQVALGYSLGGYASWSLALLHAEEMAGVVTVASCFTVPPAEDGLWKVVLPNLAAVPVLAVWGDRDPVEVYDSDGARLGTMAEMNRRFLEWTAGMELPIRHHREPRLGHSGLVVPRRSFDQVLAGRRARYPSRIEHTFRHLHQGRAYWLEAHAWNGDAWGATRPTVRRGPEESELAAFGRVARDLLGRLVGSIDGQAIAVETRHVGDLTVWIGDGMIDWERPVTLDVDGNRAFAGTVRPDLGVALAAAARSFDLDRLRWAGLRVRNLVSGTPHVEPVTATTALPPLLGQP